MLRSRFAIYEKGESWLPYVVRDGRLITGQNPASATLAALTVMEYVKGLK
jgi:putative intracellular protease/amidase